MTELRYREQNIANILVYIEQRLRNSDQGRLVINWKGSSISGEDTLFFNVAMFDEPKKGKSVAERDGEKYNRANKA